MYFTTGHPFLHQNYPFYGGSGPHLVHGSLGPPKSTSQMTSQLVQLFCMAHEHDRLTDHATRLVTIYVVLWCGLKQASESKAKRKRKRQEETGSWKRWRHWIWSVVIEFKHGSRRMWAAAFVFVSTTREIRVFKHEQTDHLVSHRQRDLYIQPITPPWERHLVTLMATSALMAPFSEWVGGGDSKGYPQSQVINNSQCS